MKGPKSDCVDWRGPFHTAIVQVSLNANDKVEYANFFTGHPDLDEPELYVRVKKGAKADKIVKDLCSDIAKELTSASEGAVSLKPHLI